jgi:hypothetical protein
METFFYCYRGKFMDLTCKRSDGASFVSSFVAFMLICSAVDLQVEHIREVEWNKEAFTSLVADENTKELITALVTNQLAAERGTDLMSGKGTGKNTVLSVRILKLILILRLDNSASWVRAP